METKARSNLLTDRRFWPVFWTQFLGAFNDNIFKNALVILITLKAFRAGPIPAEQTVALCGGIFILPFFLFSATAGQLADRFSKPRLIFWIKIWELLVMMAGAYGFLTDRLWLLLAVLFFMGLHSTFFGPVKYSILPQLLREDELLSGNAWVEMGTFLSILLGTVLGGCLINLPDSGPWMVSGAVITVAFLGCLMSLCIEPLASGSPRLRIQVNPIPPTLEILRIATRRHSVFLSILGISWFWFFGAVSLSLLPIYCKEILRGSGALITFFLALFSIGLGAGSILCGRLSRGRLDLGLVPVGALGMSLFGADLFLAGVPHSVPGGLDQPMGALLLLSTFAGRRIVCDLFLMSVFGGLFIVPLYTFIQQHSREEERSRIIAANNIMNALFMTAGSVLLMILFSFGFSAPWIFLLLSVLNLVVAVYIYRIIPDLLFRFLCWVIANAMYRLKVTGRENFPLEGPAVLVCNHVSFIDWLIVSGACPRPVRFVMHHKFLKIRPGRRIFQDAGVIPIASSLEDPKVLEEAFDRIAGGLEKGEIVCIFPEGRITKTGKMNKFRPGIEWIVRRTPVPVIPMALGGLWGSFFSKKHGKPMSRPFRRFRSRVSLSIGKPIAPVDVTAERLRAMVAELDGCGSEGPAAGGAVLPPYGPTAGEERAWERISAEEGMGCHCDRS